MRASPQASVEETETHLSDLLDRAERGEAVTIIRQGRPVARLVPAEPTQPTHDVQKATAALDALWKLREQIRVQSGPITLEEILAARHEGHRY